MNKFKITDRQLALIYTLILDDISKTDRTTPIGYVEDLQKLELLFNEKINESKSIKTTKKV